MANVLTYAVAPSPSSSSQGCRYLDSDGARRLRQGPAEGIRTVLHRPDFSRGQDSLRRRESRVTATASPAGQTRSSWTTSKERDTGMAHGHRKYA